jgi:hypothetical protein
MDLAELVAAVNNLNDTVVELSERANTQQKVLSRIEKVSNDTRSNRIGLIVATAAIGVCLVLLGLVGWLFVKLNETTHELQQVQERTSSEILCPLYEVFATSIKVNPPNPNLSPEQASARQRAADTILAGLDKLGCA